MQASPWWVGTLEITTGTAGDELSRTSFADHIVMTACSAAPQPHCRHSDRHHPRRGKEGHPPCCQGALSHCTHSDGWCDASSDPCQLWLLIVLMTCICQVLGNDGSASFSVIIAGMQWYVNLDAVFGAQIYIICPLNAGRLAQGQATHAEQRHQVGSGFHVTGRPSVSKCERRRG
jgi:hypothetical protein